MNASQHPVFLPANPAHPLLVLGVESSCDETGVALVTLDPQTGRPKLLGQALHTQVAMHAAYGGVVPELASRDHIRRVVPLLRQALAEAQIDLAAVDAIAYTAGPGLAGALLVGSAFAEALAFALEKPVVPVHHLEGHLLSPLLAANPPPFPFVALLVSGGHTQLMRVTGVGDYELLGETLDDAAGEAFDKTAKLIGLGYPGGPALAKLAETADPALVAEIKLPRPMLHSGDLEFSFAGLKTAVLTRVRAAEAGGGADGRRACGIGGCRTASDHRRAGCQIRTGFKANGVVTPGRRRRCGRQPLSARNARPGLRATSIRGVFPGIESLHR